MSVCLTAIGTNAIYTFLYCIVLNKIVFQRKYFKNKDNMSRVNEN